jgi:hypothetical protein
VRGLAYCIKVSPQMSNRIVDAARGIFNKLIPDVYIFTDLYKGKSAGACDKRRVSLTLICRAQGFRRAMVYRWWPLRRTARC